jgi:Uma2 family endonuclease
MTLLVDERTEKLPFEIKRFTVAECMELVGSGAIQSPESLELLDGYLVKKMPQDAIHFLILSMIAKHFEQLLPEGWHVRSQGPLFIDETSMPEPDVAIIEGQLEDFEIHHPTATHAALVIEVANSTLAKDRGFKSRLYAQAGIPTYWIVDTNNRTIEVRTHPASGEQPGYLRSRVYMSNEEIEFSLGDAFRALIVIKNVMPSS